VALRITVKSPETWNAEYAGGKWDYFADVSQAPRYVVLAEWCRRFATQPTILDLGCGETILIDYLAGFSSYCGVDSSQVAIDRATRRRSGGERTITLFVASIEDFVPSDQSFDVIVFNESLYYCDDPISVVERYLCRLTPAGLVLFSIGFKHGDLASLLEETYSQKVLESVAVADRRRSKGWRLIALQP